MTPLLWDFCWPRTLSYSDLVERCCQNAQLASNSSFEIDPKCFLCMSLNCHEQVKTPRHDLCTDLSLILCRDVFPLSLCQGFPVERTRCYKHVQRTNLKLSHLSALILLVSGNFCIDLGRACWIPFCDSLYRWLHFCNWFFLIHFKLYNVCTCNFLILYEHRGSPGFLILIFAGIVGK